MPIYEFKCRECGKKFEKLCRMGEKQGVVCPSCGGESDSIFSTFFARDGSSGSSIGSTCAGCSGGDCAHCK